MLRISMLEGLNSVRMQLSGKLNTQTVPLLTQRWADVKVRTRDRNIIFDLGELNEIDESGRQLLHWLAEAGALFSQVHPSLRAAIENAVCRQDVPRSRFHKVIRTSLDMLGCHTMQPRFLGLCRLLCRLLPSAFRPCGCRVVSSGFALYR